METNRQFHQCFTHELFVQNFGAKNYKAEMFAYNFWRQNIGKNIARKTLMKLTQSSLKVAWIQSYHNFFSDFGCLA